MVETTKIKGGKSALDIVEAEAGGREHRAILLCELEGAAETAAAEFAYEDGEAAGEVARLARELAAHLARVSVASDASLTLYRECRRCSGGGEPGCLECGGRGSVHADEAEG